MALFEIARLVRRDWQTVPYTAKCYLDAMATMKGVEDRYWHESGASIVAHFLANATTWRGPIARQVKAELNRLIK